jgi:hypothetical protein
MPARSNIQVYPFLGLGGKPAGTGGAVEVEGGAAFGTEGVGVVMRWWLRVSCGVAHACWWGM